MNRIIAVIALAFTMAAGLLTGTLAQSPPRTVACGVAPGFCPNPPSDSGQTHTVSPDGTVGTGQDF